MVGECVYVWHGADFGNLKKPKTLVASLNHRFQVGMLKHKKSAVSGILRALSPQGICCTFKKRCLTWDVYINSVFVGTSRLIVKGLRPCLWCLSQLLMPLSPPGATQECGVVGIFGLGSCTGRVHGLLGCQVGIKTYVGWLIPIIIHLLRCD